MPSFFSRRKLSRKKNDPIGNIIPASPIFTSDTASASASSTSTSAKPTKSILRSTTASATNREKTNEAHKIQFRCQLAQGSPTVVISGFSSVKDLYQKIAAQFEIPEETILYCTLNTHKLDMNKLLGGQIGLEDLIFAHVKGQPKEVELTKSEAAIGLTITDNGAGYSFIKRIKEGSVADGLKNLIKVGDHIEKINGQSMVGKRHFEVATVLKDIRLGSTFKIRLVEPIVFDFPLEPAKRTRKAGDVKNGTKTLRFKADGQVTIEEVDDTMTKAVERINSLLETFMGINDAELSQQIWDLAQNKKNPSDFAAAIDESELGSFNFTDEFIFDLWASIGDIKAGRVPDPTDQSERL